MAEPHQIEGTAAPGLPPPLLLAAAEANGKVVLVLGAGCSVMTPTSVPMAKECSQKAYRSLVEDGVLAEGACPDPDDLSALADVVFAMRGRQAELVERLPREQFLRARANSGYLIAAALLRENVISSILTLNFDLAMEHALTQLSALAVHKIARPEDMPHFVAQNVVYLHRNVDEVDPEKWVLRRSALDSEWKGGWEEMMARVIVAAPVVVFAGLGNPAAVLLETTRRIKACIAGFQAYQVDPSPPASNKFFKALGLSAEAYLKLGWEEFMALLGDRVLIEQLDTLRGVCAEQVRTESFAVTNLDLIIGYLRMVGLVELGKIRAGWLSMEECYASQSPVVTPLLAHVVIAASAVAHAIGAGQIIVHSEIVEYLAAPGSTLTFAMMASGRGVRGWAAMEAEVGRRRATIRPGDRQPRFAVVAGAVGLPLAAVVTPSDIVADPRPEGDIVDDARPFVLVDAYAISRDPGKLRDLV